MATFVKFPGTADNVSTDDVNLLDADTAHLSQSVGGWAQAGGTNGTVSYWEESTGDYGSLRLEVTATGAFARWAWAGSVPIATGTASYAVTIQNDQATNRDIILRVESSVGGTVNNTVTATPGLSTHVVPAAVEGNLTQLRLQVSTGEQVGDVFHFSKIMVAEGSVASFVPSLRIVGDLFEDIDPSDMPIVFAADGTPLTVGEGWAGNGYHYRRYDGANSLAPLVAQFSAEDVPVVTQLPSP